MRRKDRRLPPDEALLLLENGEYGVLASVDEKGQPYGVPLSYLFLNKKIYFHCAQNGHKIDNIRKNNKVSFTVVGKVQAFYDHNFTTRYESVVAFGKVFEILDKDEKFTVLYGLAERYLPEYLDRAKKDIETSFKRTAVYGVIVEEISGKAKKPQKNSMVSSRQT